MTTCAWCENDMAFVVAFVPICEQHLVDELAEVLGPDKPSVSVGIPSEEP